MVPDVRWINETIVYWLINKFQCCMEMVDMFLLNFPSTQIQVACDWIGFDTIKLKKIKGKIIIK